MVALVGPPKLNVRRVALPALAAAVLLMLVLGFASRPALPGDTLYPVRQTLQRVDLAEPTMDDVDELVARARVDVEAAQRALKADDRYEALDPAVDAMQILQVAREYIEQVPPPDKAIRYARIEGLARKASEVIAERRDTIRGVTESDGFE